MATGASLYVRTRDSKGTNSSRGIWSIAASTRSLRMPRLRNCVSTIVRRSAAQSGITLPSTSIIAMMAHQITLIPGDGIGPEVADATVRAIDATGVTVEWERVEVGPGAL